MQSEHGGWKPTETSDSTVHRRAVAALDFIIHWVVRLPLSCSPSDNIRRLRIFEMLSAQNHEKHSNATGGSCQSSVLLIDYINV